jgi:hypothetical protein
MDRADDRAQAAIAYLARGDAYADIRQIAAEFAAARV